jgi:hypothetical protein
MSVRTCDAEESDKAMLNRNLVEAAEFSTHIH